MIEEKVEKINKFLDEKSAVCGLCRRKLLHEGRTDEAAFEKVKENVCQIFRSVLSVAVKTSNHNPEAAKSFFLQKMEEIPSNWKAAYEKAGQNDDAEKMQIEQIKLDTAREIKEQFVKLWEDET